MTVKMAALSIAAIFSAGDVPIAVQKRHLHWILKRIMVNNRGIRAWP